MRVAKRLCLCGLAAMLVLASAGAGLVQVPPARPGVAERSKTIALPKPPSGRSGWLVVDLQTGEVIDRSRADETFVPASVAKAVTATYALDHLGPDHRFETRVATTGEVRGDQLDGDLILIGGGDPELDSAALVPLAQQTAAAGIRRVTGRFLVDARRMPELPAIEPSQPEDAVYNPGLSGLNLNFNRVRVEWRAGAKQHQIRVTARADRIDPPVRSIRVTIDPSVRAPAFRYAVDERGERWTMAGRALQRGGGRWLPVRMPATYAAEVFRNLAETYGVTLGQPATRPAGAKRAARPGDTVGLAASGAAGSVLASRGEDQAASAGAIGLSQFGLGARPLVAGQSAKRVSEADAPTVIATGQSRPLRQILRGMLRHSTNLTAESVGLEATRARGLSHSDLSMSAAHMNDWALRWLGERPGDASFSFANHSGLSVASRLSPGRMVDLLLAAHRMPIGSVRPHPSLPGPLAGLLREYRIGDAKGAKRGQEVDVVAKTGTMQFVRGLAGYIATPGGRQLAFAVFSNDLEKRGRATPRFRRGWRARAQNFERALIQRWAQMADAG